MSTTSYIFWLFDWDVVPVYETRRYFPKLIQCSVNQNQITLFTTENNIVIPIQQIERVEEYRFFQGLFAGSTVNLHLKLTAETKLTGTTFTKSDLFLDFVNVLSERPLRSYDEIKDMIILLDALKRNETPTIHPNPYYRELARHKRVKEFSAEKWIATVAPNQYTQMITPSKFWLLMIVVVPIIIVAILLIAGIIFNFSK